MLNAAKLLDSHFLQFDLLARHIDMLFTDVLDIKQENTTHNKNSHHDGLFLPAAYYVLLTFNN